MSTTRRMVAIVALAMGSSQARAEERATRTDGIRGHVLIGQASIRTLGDDVYNDNGGDYGGLYGNGGLALDMDELATLHGIAGVHARFDFTVVSPGVVIREDKNLGSTPEAPRLLGFGTAEAALGPAFEVARSHDARFRFRLSPEAFLGFDRRGLGIAAHAVILGFTVRFALRSGATWGGMRVLEEQLHLGYTTRSGFEIGLRRIHGNAEDELGRADLRGVLKGGYGVTGIYFQIPLRKRR